MIFNDKLLIMSVYGGESSKWYPLQSRFIAENTGNYEHAVYLNNCNKEIFTGCNIIGSCETSEDGKIQHYKGLLKLLEYARSFDHRAWLILDCDSFPIDPRWETIIGFRNACVIRVENLDTFYHPCIAYCIDRSMDCKISKHVNLMGGPEFEELAISANNVFPLLRTNKINHHPLMAGIYYDIFYHHCAGSRDFCARSDSYYDTMPTADLDNLLFDNPHEFINEMVLGIHS